MDQPEFDTETALEAALSLKAVLARRTHRKKILGQEVIVPGQLGEALRLPGMISKLQSKLAQRRERGLEDFQSLWPTLSYSTREQVLMGMGWYNPHELDWDDKRSNRLPIVNKP